MVLFKSGSNGAGFLSSGEKEASLIPVFTFGPWKKVWIPLEFPGPPAVFNSYRENRRNDGEKILRRDIK